MYSVELSTIAVFNTQNKVAVGLNDGSILTFDIDTKKELEGFKSPNNGKYELMIRSF